MLTEAIAAARTGDRPHARDLLTRLMRGDSTNVDVWVWMSSVVDSPRERVYCLESALRLDPTNRAVLRGLVILGARTPADADRVPPLRVARRAVPAYTARPRRGPSTFNWVLVGASLLGLVMVVGSATVLLRLIRPLALSVAPTLPPVSPTAGSEIPVVVPPTPIPVETRIFRTPVPTELAGTPLAFFVPITPTPTGLLGVTPHPSFEAYSAGVAALQRGDYPQAVEFFDQVLELEPRQPDIHFLRAEALLRMGEPGQAIVAYDRALVIDPNYAPAYLGRGRALLEIRPSEFPRDYDKVLELEPLLAEAYLAKAEYYAENRLWKTMEETLQAAIDAGVREPRVYIELSIAQFNGEKYAEALESAIVGSANDPTLLEGYLAVGSAYVEIGQFVQALWPLQTYVAYAPQDHRGWAYLGRAQLGSGQLEAAFTSLNLALSLNDHYAPAYLGRGSAFVALGDGSSALNDFLQARRYGREGYYLGLGFAKAWTLLGEYAEALGYANTAIQISANDQQRADGYAARALIYESTNPPLTEDAVFTWRLLLGLEGVAPETRALAESHLLELTGEGPTRTPTLIPTTEIPPTETAVPQTPTPVGPTASPTPLQPPSTPVPTQGPPGPKPI